MTDQSKHLRELSRVADLFEQATEASEDLNAAMFNCIAEGLTWPESKMYWRDITDHRGARRVALNFSGSQDDAELLIPASRFTEMITQDRHTRRWKRTLRGGFGIRSSARGQTLPLTTCAVALRARIEELKENKDNIKLHLQD